MGNHETEFHDNHETKFHASRRGDRRRDIAVEEAEVVTAPDRLYHETNFHASRRGDRRLSHEVEIAGEDWSVQTLVDLERLRRENGREFRVLLESYGDETRRCVLACLVRSGPSTYEDLAGWTTTTTRTVKAHVHDLRDEGVLAVEDGRPATVSFSSGDLRLLASDLLSYLSYL